MNDNHNCLFVGKLENDHESWHKYLRLPKAFLPLVKYICEINKISFDENLLVQMPTGAVFRVGSKVIKIYFPPEVKTRFSDNREYITELAAIEYARSVGVLVPDIICTGKICDEFYTFDYIVMSYVEGVLAKDLIPGYNDDEKIKFVVKLKDILHKLHFSVPELDIPHFNDPGKIHNDLWNNLPESFREDRLRYIRTNFGCPDIVVCHGDLGGQNIIIDSKGFLHIIDFAESIYAPSYYDENGFFQEHGSDSVLMKAFYGDYKKDEFYEMVTMSMLLGWFSGVSIRWLAEKIDYDFNRITNVKALKAMLIKLLDKVE